MKQIENDRIDVPTFNAVNIKTAYDWTINVPINCCSIPKSIDTNLLKHDLWVGL